jgi:hypothetical protein
MFFALLFVLVTPVLATNLPLDPALNKPVTIAAKGEAISDVTAMLHNQTGVNLKADPGIADQKVTIFVDDMPLRDLMDKLAGVFEYNWKVSGGRAYVISEPAEVRAAREKAWQRFVSDSWADVDATVRRRAVLTVDQSALQAEMKRIQSLPQSGDSNPWQERNKMMDERETPIAAVLMGDLAFGKLYSKLSREEVQALKDGNSLHFDSQSEDPDWKVPSDVMDYVKPFVQMQECFSPRFGSKGVVPDWERCGLTLQAFVNRNGVRLDGNVLLLPLDTKKIQYLPQYQYWLNSIHVELPDRNLCNLPPSMPDASSLNVRVDMTVEELGSEARTMAWNWNNNYWITRSDALAVMHRKFGIQVVSDHYTSYTPRQSWGNGDHSLYQELMQTTRGDCSWRWDGKCLYMRDKDVRNSDAVEIPNRLLRKWQADAKQGYVTLDDYGEIAQLNDTTLGELDHNARLLGLESIHWDLRWAQGYRSLYAKLYGQLSPTQKKQAMEGGLPISSLSPGLKSLLEEIAADPQSNRQRAMGPWPASQITVGIYGKDGNRIDNPSHKTVSAPVLTIRSKLGGTTYMWFRWPNEPFNDYGQEIQDASTQAEALKSMQRMDKNARTADLKIIKHTDYEFQATLANGKGIDGLVSVPWISK